MSQDESLEILLVEHALETYSIPADSLLSEPELTIFVLEDGEEVTQVLDHGHVDNRRFSFIRLTASADPTNDDQEDDGKDVDNKWGSRSDLREPLREFVALERVELEIVDFRDQILKHLLVGEEPGCIECVEDWSKCECLQRMLG